MPLASPLVQASITVPDAQTPEFFALAAVLGLIIAVVAIVGSWIGVKIIMKSDRQKPQDSGQTAVNVFIGVAVIAVCIGGAVFAIVIGAVNFFVTS